MARVDVDIDSLIIGKAKITELWELGIYSDLAFVHAALEYWRKSNGDFFDLDLEGFMHNWRGIPDPDTGRAKKLTKRRLLTSIATLEEKGLIEMKSSQLSLVFE